MFRKKKKKAKMKYITETIIVNGVTVLMYYNVRIDKKGVKKAIVEYAATVADVEEQIEAAAALINLDFFDGLADVKLSRIDDTTIVVKLSRPKKVKKVQNK